MAQHKKDLNFVKNSDGGTVSYPIRKFLLTIQEVEPGTIVTWHYKTDESKDYVFSYLGEEDNALNRYVGLSAAVTEQWLALVAAPNFDPSMIDAEIAKLVVSAYTKDDGKIAYIAHYPVVINDTVKRGKFTV